MVDQVHGGGLRGCLPLMKKLPVRIICCAIGGIFYQSIVLISGFFCVVIDGWRDLTFWRSIIMPHMTPLIMEWSWDFCIGVGIGAWNFNRYISSEKCVYTCISTMRGGGVQTWMTWPSPSTVMQRNCQIMRRYSTSPMWNKPSWCRWYCCCCCLILNRNFFPLLHLWGLDQSLQYWHWIYWGYPFYITVHPGRPTPPQMRIRGRQ